MSRRRDGSPKCRDGYPYHQTSLGQNDSYRYRDMLLFYLPKPSADKYSAVVEYHSYASTVDSSKSLTAAKAVCNLCGDPLKDERDSRVCQGCEEAAAFAEDISAPARARTAAPLPVIWGQTVATSKVFWYCAQNRRRCVFSLWEGKPVIEAEKALSWSLTSSDRCAGDTESHQGESPRGEA